MFRIGFGMSLDWGARLVLRSQPQRSPSGRYMRFMVSARLLAAGSAQDDLYLKSQTFRLVLEAVEVMNTGSCMLRLPKPTLTCLKMTSDGQSLSSLRGCFSAPLSQCSHPLPPQSCQTQLQRSLTRLCFLTPAFADSVTLCFESHHSAGLLPLVLQLPNLMAVSISFFILVHQCPTRQCYSSG